MQLKKPVLILRFSGIQTPAIYNNLLKFEAMQKIILSLLSVVVLFSIGCKKGEVIQDYKALGIGSYVTLVKSNNQIIDYGNLSTSTASIVVRENGSPIDKVTVYVTKGNISLTKANWKKIKTLPYSGDLQLDVKATEMAAALGIPVTGLETGATYTLYNELTTKDGRVFDITNTNGSYAGNTNYNMVMTWPVVVVCPFVATGFSGNFKVVEDGWGDYNVGDVLQVVTGPGATEVTMVNVYPNPAFGGFNAQQWKVSVTQATGAATVASQVYGSYAGFDNNIKVKTVGTNNWIFTCTGAIILRLNHTGAANWGDYNLKLQKL
jgi:hypothetical protein